MIKDIEKQRKTHEHDWFDDLNARQQQSVMRGLQQADNGETISHEEAIIRLGLRTIL